VDTYVGTFSPKVPGSRPGRPTKSLIRGLEVMKLGSNVANCVANGSVRCGREWTVSSKSVACMAAAPTRFDIATDQRDLGCVTEVANEAAPTERGRNPPAQPSLIESSPELRSQLRRVPEPNGSDSANEQRTTGSKLRRNSQDDECTQCEGGFEQTPPDDRGRLGVSARAALPTDAHGSDDSSTASSSKLRS